MFEHFSSLFIRSVLGFSVLLLLTRWMGRKQMAQLTYFDYVTGITIGSIAASLIVEQHVHLLDGMLSLIFWALFTVGMNIIVLKSRKARNILEGKPVLLIEEGKILYENMKKMRFSLDDLQEELREKEVFNISDVLYAFLETDGQISIMLKPKDTRKHVPSLPIELIMDGQILYSNLTQYQLTEDWLLKQLAKRNVRDISEVVYACIGSNQEFYLDLRKKRNNAPVH